MQKDNIACKLQKQMAWNLSQPENRTEDFLHCLVNPSGNSVPSTLVPFLLCVDILSVWEGLVFRPLVFSFNLWGSEM